MFERELTHYSGLHFKDAKLLGHNCTKRLVSHSRKGYNVFI